MTRFIGVGWDVGGWMGKNHGIAVCEWDNVSETVHWSIKPVAISLPEGELLSLSQLLRHAGYHANWDEQTRVTIGVDAPLGYPEQYTRLLNGESVDARRPEREIDNPLAYRLTDRIIHRVCGKKPLSASFDRIGNNATVAMVHAIWWKNKDGFILCPQDDETKSHRHIIETYPALVKESRYKRVLPFLENHMPQDLEPGTDAYDAAICALYAMAYQTDGVILPRLIHPDEEEMSIAKKEGWIYRFQTTESD